MPISNSPIRDVFVIHAEEDDSLGCQIVEFLEGHGIQGWIRNRDFPQDGERGSAILAAIAAARILVVIYSVAANESRAAQNEVLRGMETNKLIIPFRTTQLPPTGSMELLLRRRYCVSALRPPLEASLEELYRIIKPFVNQPRKMASGLPISRTLPARAAILAEPPSFTPAREPMGPFQAAIHSPRIAERNLPNEVELIVANQSQQILEEVEVELHGETLAAPGKEIIPDLSPGTQARLSFQFRPLVAGACVLHVSIRGYDSLTKFAYHGFQSLTISGSGEETIVAGGARKASPAPAQDHAEVTRATMTFARSEEAALPTITLPDGFKPLPLSLDYAHSLDAEVVDKSQASLAIPFAFLAQREDGTLLTLERMDDGSPLPHQDIRISARPAFVLGRSREEADFLLWFWPRNEIHDARTVRISKKQCTLSLERGECRIRDTATASITTYEDVPLTEFSAVLKRRGTLNLSGNYRLEIIKIDPANGAVLDISNLENWKGPLSTDSPKASGCVSFKAASANVLPQSACWLLSEGTFGTSQANALVIDLPGLAEIQGRFRHFQNCFWLENSVDNGAVVIDNHVVKPRSLVPLVTGKIIKLAGVRFTPRITT
jgi:hypothetical protein